jgi:hypothetical protein
MYVLSNMAVRSDSCVLDFSQMVLVFDILRSQICFCCSQLHMHYRLFSQKVKSVSQIQPHIFLLFKHFVTAGLHTYNISLLLRRYIHIQPTYQIQYSYT